MPRDLSQDKFRNAIDHGATRLCLCDTVGHVTPDGIRNLLRFTRSLLDAMNGQIVNVDKGGPFSDNLMRMYRQREQWGL